METTLQTIKQPKPSTAKSEEVLTIKKPKREYKRPEVGVVDVPQISKTPLSDTLVKRQEENPHIIYKIDKKDNKNLNFHNVLSLITVGLGITSFVSLIKSFKK